MKRLISESGSGGWSKETYLITQKGKKYVVRKCKTLKKAKSYEEIERRLGKYNILPRLIKREGKNVFYEYIEGRDLSRKESKKVIEQIGKIAAHVNKIKVKGTLDDRFNKQMIYLNFSKDKEKKIKKLYKFLKKKSKPKLVWDINDLNPDNFRLNKKGKVYLVDIEGIKPRAKLFCMGKGLFKWFKSKTKKKSFKKGYQKVSSIEFFNEYYSDFILLNFLIQDINYNKKYGDKYKPRVKIRHEKIEDLLVKYKTKLK